MKNKDILLSLTVCLIPGTALADDKSSAPQEGDTVRLEEKISPKTRWIERLVKPLSNVVGSGLKKDGLSSSLDNQHSVDSSGAGGTSRQNERLSQQRIHQLAQQRVTGEVLTIRYLQPQQQYQVKLVSTQGEIHILYFDAYTGTQMQANTDN